MRKLWWFAGDFFGPFGVRFSPRGSEFHRKLASIKQASRRTLLYGVLLFTFCRFWCPAHVAVLVAIINRY